MLLELFNLAHADQLVRQHQEEIRREAAKERLLRSLRQTRQGKEIRLRRPRWLDLGQLFKGVRYDNLRS